MYSDFRLSLHEMKSDQNTFNKIGAGPVIF